MLSRTASSAMVTADSSAFADVTDVTSYCTFVGMGSISVCALRADISNGTNDKSRAIAMALAPVSR